MLYGGTLFLHKDKISTDIMEMIPSTGNDAAIQMATDKFIRTLAGKIVMVFSSPDTKQAIDAADTFEKIVSSKIFFSDLDVRFGNDANREFFSMFFPHRWSLLSNDARRTVIRNDVAAFCELAVRNLYQPLNWTGSLIKRDPFFLFTGFLESLPRPSGCFAPSHGHLVCKRDGLSHVLLTATVSDKMRGAEEQCLVDGVNKLANRLSNRFQDVAIHWTGMIKYAAYAQSKSRNDVGLVGMGSIAGIIILFLLSFRSIKQLLAALLPVIAGLVFAWAAVGLIFDKIYIITLVFGASVTGVSIDYSLHYFAHADFENFPTGRDVLKAIFPGITLGLLTSLAGYISLAVSPLAGMRQMSMFASCGLAGAYLTVITLFPFFKPDKPRSYRPLLWYAASWLTGKRQMLVYPALIMFAAGCAGISILHADDDVRLLKPGTPELMQEEEWIRRLAGEVDRSRFILVTGNSEDELELNEASVLEQLAQLRNSGAIKNFLASTMLVPPVTIQNENTEFMKKIMNTQCVSDYFKLLGMSVDDVQALKKEIQALKPLKFKDVAHLQIANPYVILRTNGINGIFFSIVILESIHDANAVTNAVKHLNSAIYIDRVMDVSSLFGRYRSISTVIAAMAYLLVFMLLIWRYGVIQGFRVILPPLTAGTTVLGTMGFMGIPANIFTFFSLMMVLAIGIDYTLFFAESGDETGPVAFAIALSAITTLLSFGLLAFSKMPAVSHIGFIMLEGIMVAAILSPVAKQSKTY